MTTPTQEAMTTPTDDRSGDDDRSSGRLRPADVKAVLFRQARGRGESPG